MRHCQGLQWGSKTKVIRADLGTFTHILAYSGYFRQAQELFRHTRTFRNPSYSDPWYIQKSETEAYLEPCRTSTMEHVAKIVNSCISFRSFFTFSTYFNKNLFFTPKVFTPYKKV